MPLNRLSLLSDHTDKEQELVLRVDRIESGELTVDQTLKTDF
jgi:hypothetical protein